MPPKPPAKKYPRRKPKIPVAPPSNPKRGRKRSLKHPIDLGADMLLLCEAKLLHWSREKTFDVINERRMSIARKAALDRGATKEEAEKAAFDARITYFTLQRDTTKLHASLGEVKVLTAEMLARERILDLQEEILRLNLVEREAWTSYIASREGTIDVETTTTEEEGAGAAAGSKRSSRKTTPRKPEEAWLAIVLKCGERRVEIGDRIYALSAQLGLWSSMPAEVQQLHGIGADDLEALYRYSLQHVWTAEAQIAGNAPQALERAKLMEGAIDAARRKASRTLEATPGAPIELVIKPWTPAN